MDIKEFFIHQRIRSDCYRFLSACFYLPQKKIFIDEGLLKNLTASMRQIYPSAVVFSEKMEKSALEYSDEELAIEYARLFVGPFELIAPPYGSTYLDKERMIIGNSTMEIKKMYQDEGISIDNDFKELPDHITVELEFMNYLIYKEIEALEKSDSKTGLHFIETQNVFLNKFLVYFVYPFCAKIKEGTHNKFYTALAECVSHFISNEEEGMARIPEGLKAILCKDV